MLAPRVTIQLPLRNEFLMVEGLLASITALDHPKELLEIQVLDDSDDDTTKEARRLAEIYARSGFDIQVLHRPEREGFKAGALAAASVRGQFIAIFDADARPQPDFLKKILPLFSADETLGLAQGSLSYWNRNVSLLTRIQGMVLDGLMQEQSRLSRRGLPFQFNGSGGVWRRECIDAAGGWSARTLVEDLDLSIRAQLKGWRFLQVPDVVVETELPMGVGVFSQQQVRWILGSAQVLRLLGPTILRSRISLSFKSVLLLRLVRRSLLHFALLWATALLLAYAFRIFALNPASGRFALGALGGTLLVTYLFSLKSIFRSLYLAPATLLLYAALSPQALLATLAGGLGFRPDFYRTPKVGQAAFLAGVRRYRPWSPANANGLG